MGLIQLLFVLAILGAVWYFVTTYIPMPAPIKTVITIIAVIALCAVLLQMVGLNTGLGNVHL